MSFGIGERIKQRRSELKMTQMELAERMGYKSKAAICKVERGDDNITSDRVSKFAKALNCSEAYLMGWEEKVVEDKLVDAYIQGDKVIELVKSFNELDEEQQRQIVLMLAFFKSQNKDK